MKRTLGYGASTCSYRDWIGTDLIVFFGSSTPNKLPGMSLRRTTKLYERTKNEITLSQVERIRL